MKARMRGRRSASDAPCDGCEPSAVVAAARWRLEHRKIFEQRNHADDDHDRAYDLSGTGVERQHVHEIEDQNDHKVR